MPRYGFAVPCARRLMAWLSRLLLAARAGDWIARLGPVPNAIKWQVRRGEMEFSVSIYRFALCVMRYAQRG